MGSRVQLQEFLEDLIGSENVYFQPPENKDLNYPCIIYSRGIIGNVQFADGIPYLHQVGYSLTIVDADPDGYILDKVASLPMCSFERHYTANNLNHDVYNLYY